MKERPIPFRAPMVRAILAGTMTQTRRVVKPQPKNDPAIHHPIEPYSNGRGGFNWVLAATGHGLGDPFPCPYGFAGDRLWVRESLGYCSEYGHYFAADRLFLCSVFDDEDKQTGYSYECNMREGSVPSIHLPRRWSRITLDVTDVRIERLQDITPNDAVAEGLKGVTKDGKLVKYGIPDADGWPGTDDQGWPWHEWRISPVDAYRRLWEQINGHGSWASNPWVWVVEFKRGA